MIIENVCFKKYVVVNGFVSSIPIQRSNVVLQDVAVTSWGKPIVREPELMDNRLLKAMQLKFVFCLNFLCCKYLFDFELVFEKHVWFTANYF